MYIYSLLFLTLFILSLNNFNFSINLHKIFVIFFISAIIIIFTFNRQNNDYFAYNEIFSNPSEYADLGYVLFIDLLKYIGFQTHNSVQIMLALFIAFTFIKFSIYSKYISIFLPFYLVFLFPMDITQIRNTFSVYFSIMSIFLLIEKKFILFLISCLISISFHALGAIFSLIILFGFLINTYIAKRYFVVTFLALTGFIFGQYIISIDQINSLRTFSSYVAEGKIFSVIIWSGLVSSYLILINVINLNDDKYNFSKTSTLSRKSYYISSLLYNIILASLIFSAGLFYVYEFNRVYRFVLLLIIFHSSIIFIIKNNTSRYIIYLYHIFIFFSLAYYYSSELNYDYIIFGH